MLFGYSASKEGNGGASLCLNTTIYQVDQSHAYTVYSHIKALLLL